MPFTFIITIYNIHCPCLAISDVVTGSKKKKAIDKSVILMHIATNSLAYLCNALGKWQLE